jgi:hypothetical protein
MKNIFSSFIFSCVFCLMAVAQNGQPLWTVKAVKQVENFGGYKEVTINAAAIEKLYFSNENYLQLPLTDRNGNGLIADLVAKPMEQVKVKLNNHHYHSDVKLPKTFSGRIRGVGDVNNVVLTIAPNYISMQAYLNDENILLEPDSRNRNEFVLMHTPDISYQTKPWECGMTADLPAAAKKQQPISTAGTLSSSDKCVFVFVDCSNALFMNQQSNVQNTVNYVYSIWNNLRTAFNNEQLNVLISEINVWTVADPFNTMSTSQVANRSFADYYQDNYWGNMAMLLDWSGVNGGIAGGYGWAKSLSPNTCGNYDATPNPSWNFGSFAYCNLNGSGTFINAPVPALDWQIKVCVHELGHLFSSWHTHSCSWPGGPIDNCVAKEGTCAENGPAPSNGGTTMSYCHLSSVGVNFNNGFGPLPGDTIRQFVVNNPCISNCTSCVTNEVIGNIAVTGFQQKEVTNQLIANGNLSTTNGFLKLDAGNRIILQPGFRVAAGNKVQVIIDGCGGIR